MASYIQPSISMLYNTFVYNKQKDKIDMILEPLQSMLQLALLSICPVGTKLRIKENILYIQMPNIAQPFVRWYNADKKELAKLKLKETTEYKEYLTYIKTIEE